MMKRSTSSASGLRSWFRLQTYWDGWFDLLEKMRAAVGQLLGFSFTRGERQAYSRRLRYFPEIEGLEVRVMLTTVSVQTSSQQVDYNDGTAYIHIIPDDTYGGSVDYTTVNGTAIDGVDYSATSGTASLSGQSDVVIPVSVFGGGDKFFYFSLSNPSGASLGSPTSDTVTIVGPPTVDMVRSTQKVNFNATTALVDVQLSKTFDKDTTVDYATADNTAFAGTDYVSTSGTLTISAGYTTGQITIPLLGHQEGSNKTFTLLLTNPTNGDVGTDTDTLTILNQPSLAVDAATNVTLPLNVPTNSFSEWHMNLRAQNPGTAVTAYSWDFSYAPEAGSIHNANTFNPTFTWSSFSGAARGETILLTETTASGGQQVQAFGFLVAGTGSPAWVANGSQPTSPSTWPAKVGPDKLQAQPTMSPSPKYLPL